ncbi:MAG TPA: glycosyltransferase [Patescibacteria group bacterium]|nr:glycosyltransferase [Patescibacteria group bacterium]
MKIALVHDYLVQYGGAERVLECFCELYPYAPIYTIVYNKDLMHGALEGKDIRTSYLQKIPFVSTHHRIFPPLMPMAIEQFSFNQFDIILSDSSSFAKGIITSPDTLHICYMHTPMRYAWDDCQKYTEEFYFPRFIKRIVPFLMNRIRVWDRVSADRPDFIIANSGFIKKRIKKYYKRDSSIIYPPVNFENFYISETIGDYFLLVGRFMRYKRFDLVISAFNELKMPLKIIGRGPEMEDFKKNASSNIEFLGRVSDEELARYYSECKAFIFPQEEDFGITAIEAMASGRPIIAYRGGDIPEHMEEGKTGILFDTQSSQDLIKAIRSFDENDYNPTYIREKAKKFDKKLFKDKIKAYIEDKYAKFKADKS